MTTARCKCFFPQIRDFRREDNNKRICDACEELVF